MDIQEKDRYREESGGLRTRRVGSVTFGLTLILFGVLFLIHTVMPSLHYEMIFQFWPVVFVLLGIEILVENHKSNTDQCKFVYDFPAVLMLVVMLLFAMVMAAAEFSLQYY
ncbi:MAG: DUF5668 domain-containing protein, partial [Lachnospiraceae bacterium]|nr:DUF5668 domain-containing protein [Lachnospiraceae bacterium]